MTLTFAHAPWSPHLARAQGFTRHDPIYIPGDAFFTATNGVVGGSGLPENPWVIAGWEINTTGGPSPGAAIHITGTHASFIIKNIYVHTTSSQTDTSGVYLENAPNGAIENVQVTGPFYGLWVSSSSSTLIRNNTVWNTTNGIYLASGSTYSVASNNIIRNSTGIGMWIASDIVTITDNNVACNGATCTGYLVTINHSVFDRNVAKGNCHIAKETCYGYRIIGSSNNMFLNNSIFNNAFGFIVNGGDSGNIVKGNRASGNQDGIGLEGGLGSENTDNTVSENNITDNDYGIYTFMSLQNRIFDNYLRNNVLGNANDANATDGNLWNIPRTLGTNILGGPFLGGNYYSDYTGVDSDGDGLGDTPYTNFRNVDHLPLVAAQPSVVHDIAVTGVNIQPSSSNSGSSFTITVDLFNNGSTTENFMAYTYYDQTLIGTNPLANIAAQTSTITNFTWSTVGVAAGNYTITAKVPPLSGEIVTKNNNSSLTVKITPDKPPTAAFTANMLTVFVHTPVSFDASSSQDPDGRITAYSWNFGDNSIANGVNQTHTFSVAGNYTVTLTVKDNSGSVATTTELVSVFALKPTAPQNLQVESAQGVIRLTWALPIDNGGAPITGYRVYRGIDPNSLVFYKTVTGSLSSYDDTGVSAGQVYYYRVTAVNSAGESLLSNQESQIVPQQQQNQGSAILIASLFAIVGVAAALALLLRNRSKRASRTE